MYFKVKIKIKHIKKNQKFIIYLHISFPDKNFITIQLYKIYVFKKNVHICNNKFADFLLTDTLITIPRLFPVCII